MMKAFILSAGLFGALAYANTARDQQNPNQAARAAKVESRENGGLFEFRKNDSRVPRRGSPCLLLGP